MTQDETHVEDAGAEAAQSEHVGAPSPRELLRHALVNDDDPRFPWWLAVPGLALAVLWAGYRAAVASATPELAVAVAPLEVFLTTLLWPGVAIFVLASVATWAGWQLEID